MDWTHKIRLRHLQVLLSLAETQNISHSARVLHMTQPGLSKWLKEVEADVGLALFERHARGLRPTEHGKSLIAHARRIEAHLSTARDEMQSLVQGGSGLVRIGTSGAAAADTVPLAVLGMLARRPAPQVRLTENTMDRLMEGLAHGELDIIVGRAGDDQLESGIRTEPLYMEPIHFVTRPRHPVLSVEQPSWEDVLSYPWVVWPRGIPIRGALDTALASEGRALPPGSTESNSVTMNLTLLNHSNMIGFASLRAALRFCRMNVMAVVPFRIPGFGSVAMYWREDAAARAAVNLGLAELRKVVGSFSDSALKG